MNIGDFIRIKRTEKDLTINQLAKYSKVSSAHISRIERGLRQPSPEILKKLSTVLDSSYTQLMCVAGYSEEEFNMPSCDFNMLGKRLKKLRNKKKLTQEQVAQELRIPRGTYAHYEISKREPDYETLQMIADYFGVSTDYLLGRTNKKAIYAGHELKDLLEKEDQEKYDIENVEYIKFAKELEKEEIPIKDLKTALKILMQTRDEFENKEKK